MVIAHVYDTYVTYSSKSELIHSGLYSITTYDSLRNLHPLKVNGGNMLKQFLWPIRPQKGKFRGFWSMHLPRALCFDDGARGLAFCGSRCGSHL